MTNARCLMTHLSSLHALYFHSGFSFTLHHPHKKIKKTIYNQRHAVATTIKFYLTMWGQPIIQDVRCIKLIQESECHISAQYIIALWIWVVFAAIVPLYVLFFFSLERIEKHNFQISKEMENWRVIIVEGMSCKLKLN